MRFMVNRWIMFGTVVAQVGSAWGPLVSELALKFPASELAKAHAHRLGVYGDNDVVRDPISGGVISLYG